MAKRIQLHASGGGDGEPPLQYLFRYFNDVGEVAVMVTVFYVESGDSYVLKERVDRREGCTHHPTNLDLFANTETPVVRRGPGFDSERSFIKIPKDQTAFDLVDRTMYDRIRFHLEKAVGIYRVTDITDNTRHALQTRQAR